MTIYIPSHIVLSTYPSVLLSPWRVCLRTEGSLWQLRNHCLFLTPPSPASPATRLPHSDSLQMLGRIPSTCSRTTHPHQHHQPPPPSHSVGFSAYHLHCNPYISNNDPYQHSVQCQISLSLQGWRWCGSEDEAMRDGSLQCSHQWTWNTSPVRDIPLHSPSHKYGPTPSSIGTASVGSVVLSGGSRTARTSQQVQMEKPVLATVHPLAMYGWTLIVLPDKPIHRY